MKNILFFLFIIFLAFETYAQELAADDFVIITQENAAYPGFNAKTYRGLFPVGHGQFKMFNYGGVPGNLTALGANETLGSFVFNGYDGTKNVISAVIQAKTITDSKDPRFNFLLSNGVGNQRPNRMTIIGQTGNVGIGITDPTEKLDVNGSIRMRGGAMAGYIPVSDADGKMIWTDPSTISTASLWTDGGSSIYKIGANVGIGTSFPQSPLSIESSGQLITLTSTSSQNYIAFKASGNDIGYVGVDNGSDDMDLGTFSSNGVGSTNLVTGGISRLTVAADGNVGIGITIPMEKMDVDGNIRMRSGANAGYIPVSDADGKMTWTDPNSIFSPSPWLSNGTDLYYANNVAIGYQSNPDGYGLNVSLEDAAGKAVIRGASITPFVGSYAEGYLGLNNFGDFGATPNPFGLPLDMSNVGVYGNKPAIGANGAAIYGWNNDDNSLNYGGVFIADGVAASGTNYGLYASAQNGSTNWAGYFAEGNVYVKDKIGVNNETPNAYLDVETDASTTSQAIEATVNYSGTTDVRAINATSQTAEGYGYGVYGTGGYMGVRGVGNGGAATSSVYGVRGMTIGTAGTHYGIYGSASSTAGTGYAGYFGGDVTVTGTFNDPSDRKLKKNIEDYIDALDIINQLDAKTYEFKNSEYEQMGLPEGNQIGFIAQELEEVLPSLVKKNVHPEVIEHDEEGNRTIVKEAIEFKGVNYKGLIPVLTQGIKELSATVEEKEEVIEEMETKMDAMTKKMDEMTAMLENMNDKFSQIEKDMSSCCLSETDNRTGSINTNVELNGSDVPSLEQNNPNPFYEQTVIKYYIPSSAKNARMTITDMKGSPIKSVNLAGTGLGTVTINANELPVGTYIYTLFVDGKQVESKQMILVK